MPFGARTAAIVLIVGTLPLAACTPGATNEGPDPITFTGNPEAGMPDDPGPLAVRRRHGDRHHLSPWER